MAQKRCSIFVVAVVTLLVFMGMAATGFAAQQVPVRVTARLGVSPASYSGNCPALINFRGHITVSQPTTVQYKFIRSDNASAPVQTLNFPKAGTQEVTTTWQIGGPSLPTYSGWEAIQIISPVIVESNKAAFRIRCAGQGQSAQQGGPVRVKAELRVKPASYSGNCPALISFRGYIAVSQPTTVQYKFIRSDNASAPVQTLNFPKAGREWVSTTWQLGGPGLPAYSGWEAIEVISPVSVQSNKAEFKISCSGQQQGEAGRPGPARTIQPGVVTQPGTVVKPGMVTQPSVGKEDCISFDPATATVQQIRGSWKIVDGNNWLFDFGNNESAAKKSLNIITKYRMNQVCFVGRPHPSFQYMLVSGNAPAGALGGEDCISFNPATTMVQQIKGSWKIVDGNHWMFDFGSNKAEADQTLAIIQKYGFTYSCFVSRPGPFKYLRK